MVFHHPSSGLGLAEISVTKTYKPQGACTGNAKVVLPLSTCVSLPPVTVSAKKSLSLLQYVNTPFCVLTLQCPSAGITCAPTFDLSHEHLTSTTVYYKNSQCAGEGTDVLKIHQKSECEGGSSSSSCIEEDDDRSFREFCGSDFTPELVENDEEFRIVDQFASSATQRAQLVLVGFVVLDLLLCYVMVH